MKDLIFETIVTEASFRVAELTINGVELNEAISEVSREMELDKDEVQALNVRTKKPSSIKPPVEEEEAHYPVAGEPMPDLDLDNHPQANSIEFKDSVELDQAVGILMYKGIAWTAKQDRQLTFASSDIMAQAHEALKRRWDFVNANSPQVAQISFDNLEDYNKVLDFIASKNMNAVLDQSVDGLEPDTDMAIEEAVIQHKQASKAAKEQGQPAPEMPSRDLSYRAMHHDNRLDVKSLDPLSNTADRAIQILKRWK